MKRMDLDALIATSFDGYSCIMRTFGFRRVTYGRTMVGRTMKKPRLGNENAFIVLPHIILPTLARTSPQPKMKRAKRTVVEKKGSIRLLSHEKSGHTTSTTRSPFSSR